MSEEVGMTLARWASEKPDAKAIVSEQGERTFAELNAAANRTVRALRKRGLKAGDAVALVCGNRPEFPEVVFACQRGGFRLTPINWHLTAEEIDYIIGDCEAQVVIVAPELVHLVPDGPRRMIAGD